MLSRYALTFPPFACTSSIVLIAYRWSTPGSSPISFITTIPAFLISSSSSRIPGLM